MGRTNWKATEGPTIGGPSLTLAPNLKCLEDYQLVQNWADGIQAHGRKRLDCSSIWWAKWTDTVTRLRSPSGEDGIRIIVLDP